MPSKTIKAGKRKHHKLFYSIDKYKKKFPENLAHITYR